jgi:DNA-directed RNA polymerase specialized sigma subunit
MTPPLRTREQRDELVLQWLYLPRRILTDLLRRRPLPLGAMGVDRDDLEQQAFLALLKAASTWDPDRGAFPSFAWRCIHRELTRYLWPSYCARVLGGAVALPFDLAAVDSPERDDRLQLVLDALGDRDRLVLDLFAHDLCASAIGRTLGVTHQRGHQLLHRALARAKKAASRLR